MSYLNILRSKIPIHNLWYHFSAQAPFQTLLKPWPLGRFFLSKFGDQKSEGSGEGIPQNVASLHEDEPTDLDF